MTATRIYVNHDCCIGEKISLADTSSHHLTKALRLKIGARIVLFNNSSCEYGCEIIAIDRRKVIVAVLEENVTSTESLLKIQLYQAVSRGDRMDYAIQKAVECGVLSITPMMTERTNVKLSEERARKRVAHWQAISLHAAQQSGRLIVPTINPVCHFSDIQCSPSQKYFIAHPEIDSGLKSSDIIRQCALVIGPEGGFSDSEIAAAKENKFNGLNLGPRILRTETAPVVALTLLQSHYGDLR